MVGAVKVMVGAVKVMVGGVKVMAMLVGWCGFFKEGGLGMDVVFFGIIFCCRVDFFVARFEPETFKKTRGKRKVDSLAEG